MYVYIYIYIHIHYLYIYIYIYIFTYTHTCYYMQTRSRLEPQTTGLDKCNINFSILETPVYQIVILYYTILYYTILYYNIRQVASPGSLYLLLLLLLLLLLVVVVPLVPVALATGLALLREAPEELPIYNI